jgi:hypothetical protein
VNVLGGGGLHLGGGGRAAPRVAAARSAHDALVLLLLIPLLLRPVHLLAHGVPHVVVEHDLEVVRVRIFVWFVQRNVEVVVVRLLPAPGFRLALGRLSLLSLRGNFRGNRRRRRQRRGEERYLWGGLERRFWGGGGGDRRDGVVVIVVAVQLVVQILVVHRWRDPRVDSCCKR